MIKEVLLLFLFFALGYLIFSLIDELADKFIYKVKRVQIPISVKDYREIKKYLKESGSPRKVDDWLRFHFKEDIRDLLEKDV